MMASFIVFVCNSISMDNRRPNWNFDFAYWIPYAPEILPYTDLPPLVVPPLEQVADILTGYGRPSLLNPHGMDTVGISDRVKSYSSHQV